MKNRILQTLAGLLIVWAVTGCATQGNNVYRAGETLQTSQLIHGTVTSIEQVTIEGENSGMATAGGAAAGFAAGGAMGKGKGKKAASIGMALAGAIAGHYIEKAINQDTGYRVGFAADDGRDLTVVIKKADLGVEEGSRGCLEQGQRTRIVACAERAQPVRQQQSYGRRPGRIERQQRNEDNARRWDEEHGY